MRRSQIHREIAARLEGLDVGRYNQGTGEALRETLLADLAGGFQLPHLVFLVIDGPTTPTERGRGHSGLVVSELGVMVLYRLRTLPGDAREDYRLASDLAEEIASLLVGELPCGATMALRSIEPIDTEPGGGRCSVVVTFNCSHELSL